MLPWRRTVGISLGLVVASSLWTVAQADSTQETVETVPSIQVDNTQINEGQAGPATDDWIAPELPTETGVVLPDTGVTPTAVAEALAVEVTPVPAEVLANLSPAQIEAIAAIISTAAPASTDPVANLPAEVVASLDRLPGLEQPVGRRRWLPTSLVRRLRLPQTIASLVRRPRNTALVMLGNHIVVVNPVTGAVLGAVRSVL